MLRTVQFHDQARIRTQQIHFHAAPFVKGNRKVDIQAKSSSCLRQSFQAAIKERFACTSSPYFPLGTFGKCGETARHLLQALLEKYTDQGIIAAEKLDVLKVQPLSDLGTPVELITAFGGKEQYLAAIKELQTLLYEAAA